MLSRRLIPFAAAGVLAAALLPATPAAAAVTYDPVAKSGFVDLADVQRAFGWTAAKARAKASGIVFNHEFWADDTYSVTCGAAAFPVVHHREYGRYELVDTVARSVGRSAASSAASAATAASGAPAASAADHASGAPAASAADRASGAPGASAADRASVVSAADRASGSGYGRKVRGFRITGAIAGISGTSVAPVAGQPCPEPRGTTIVGVRKVSAMTGWALTATSGTTSREILVRRTPVR